MITTVDKYARHEDAELSLHARWARIGGGFTVRPAGRAVDPEQLIVSSLRTVRADPRLFWVMASWMALHVKLLDMRRLGRLLDAVPDDLTSAAAGAVADVAASLARARKPFEGLRRHCRALSDQRPLFEVVARNPALLAIAQAGARAEFLPWGFWQHEISDKRAAIRPVAWILATCPEFRYRSLFGADLDAGILEIIAGTPATVSDLARMTGASRPAVHEAIENLAARGLAEKAPQGYRRLVHVPETVHAWLSTLFQAPPSAQYEPARIAR